MGGDNNELRKLLESEMDTLFKLTHHNVFRIQLQVFMLLFTFAKVTQKMSNSIAEGQQTAESSLSALSDRFYRSLYELVLKVHMSNSAQMDEYFGVVFKAIKADLSIPRCMAFIKRLLQMSFLNEANFTAASLLIISEIFKARNDLRTAVYSLEYSGKN